MIAAFKIDVERFTKHLEKCPDTKIADWNLAEDFENLLMYNCIDDVAYIYELELEE